MTVNHLIARLQALSPELRNLEVVTYTEDGYVDVDMDRVIQPFFLGRDPDEGNMQVVAGIDDMFCCTTVDCHYTGNLSETMTERRTVVAV